MQLRMCSLLDLLGITGQIEEQFQQLQTIQQYGDTSVGMWSKPTVRRKTKIVCTIGPSTNTREMIWKLAEAGMNVARLNMSHGDHASHQKVIDLVKEYNEESKDNVIAIMLDTKVNFPLLFVLWLYLTYEVLLLGIIRAISLKHEFFCIRALRLGVVTCHSQSIWHLARNLLLQFKEGLEQQIVLV